MKKFIMGILMCTLLFTSHVGYASHVPKIEKAETDVGLFISQKNEVVYNYIAQADIVGDTVLQTHSDADAVSTVSDIAQVLSIKVDTVNSIDEIIDKGTYYVTKPPGATSNFSTWYGYIVGILGLLVGCVLYFASRWSKKE